MFKLNFALVIFSVFACTEHKKFNIANTEKSFYINQGIVIKESLYRKNRFRYVRDIYYAYRLDLKDPLTSIERGTSVNYEIGEPIIIEVNKNDSLESYILQRGAIDKELLLKFVKKNNHGIEKLFLKI
tara:strand:- start:401379 stop:401762 length:384 start_codon:yes stop_codon:yes gene_type:complete